MEKDIIKEFWFLFFYIVHYKLSAEKLINKGFHICRFKPDMWAKVAKEMAIPWGAAEAMHWHLGEQKMARRAGVVPFSLTAQNLDSGQH